MHTTHVLGRREKFSRNSKQEVVTSVRSYDFGYSKVLQVEHSKNKPIENFGKTRRVESGSGKLQMQIDTQLATFYLICYSSPESEGYSFGFQI